MTAPAPLIIEMEVDSPSVAVEAEAHQAVVSPAATVESIFTVEAPVSGMEVSAPQAQVTPATDPTVIFAVTPTPGPAGPPGEGVQVFGEVLIGALDGTNTTFTTANHFRASSTAVHLNGLRERHYTEFPPETVVFEDAPISTDDIAIDYIVAE